MSDKEIVDRLKIEGDLTRNKGKHSVKAVLLQMDKFQDLFMSIDKSLMEQTAILRTNLSVSTEEIERLKREANFQRNTETTPKVTPTEKTTPASNEQTDKSFFGGIAGLISGVLGGTGISAFRGVIGKSLISAFGLFLAPAIGNWVSDFVEQGLKNLGLNEIMASVSGDALGGATTMGLLGSIISKRLGLLFAAGGFLASFADDIASGLGFTEEQMKKDFFMGFSYEDVSQGILFAIGTSLSKFLLSKTLWSGLFSMSKSAATSVLSKAGLGVLARTTIPMAVAGAYLMYGDEAKKFLDNYVPEDIANITVDVAGLTATGASIGAMFGPGGLIVGAAIGFALGIGKSIFDWMSNTQAEMEKEVKENLDKKTNQEIIDAAKNMDNTEFTEFVGQGSAEARRRLSEIKIEDLGSGLNQSNSPVMTTDELNNQLVSTIDSKMSREYLSTATKDELDAVYTDLVNYRKRIDDFAALVEKNPGLEQTNPVEVAALNSFLGSYDDSNLTKMITMMEGWGQTYIETKPKFTSSVSPSNYDPSKMIELEPPANTSALQSAMNAGISKETAQMNMATINAPKVTSNSGNSNVVNNSTVNVVSGSENRLFGLGFAQ